jgi:uncharacterized protein YdhG (YjbR/CyaY superfamily)
MIGVAPAIRERQDNGRGFLLMQQSPGIGASTRNPVEQDTGAARVYRDIRQDARLRSECKGRLDGRGRRCKTSARRNGASQGRTSHLMEQIDRYIASLRGIRRSRARMLHWLITALFPEAQQSFRYRMPTYEVGRNFIAWGEKARYFSVYTSDPDRIAEFKARHPGIPTGKGCLNFRDGDEFPLDDLESVIRKALAPKPAAPVAKRKMGAIAKLLGKRARR